MIHPGPLWKPFIAPALWALHFLACYVTTAIICARTPAAGASIASIRGAIVVYSVLAIAAIACCMLGAVRRRRTTTQQSQQRFLADVTLLLGGLSIVATIYVALPALFFGSCQ